MVFCFSRLMMCLDYISSVKFRNKVILKCLEATQKKIYVYFKQFLGQLCALTTYFNENIQNWQLCPYQGERHRPEGCAS